MHSFASGPKRSYYGKGDVIVYRLHRDASPEDRQNPVFGANVKMLVYGDAFWPTYTTGDNSSLVATDSMKNFIQRETANFPGDDLETFCHFLADKFLNRYVQAEGVQVSATEIPYAALFDKAAAFAPGGSTRFFASVELSRSAAGIEIKEARSGIEGFRLLRLNGSAFRGFVRDEYTTLPDIHNRPLHMWLDLNWTYVESNAFLTGGIISRQVRDLVQSEFASFTSGSIQQIIHQTGTKLLAEIPSIAEVNLEANNRTWDTVLEQGESFGIYTDARPPYGILGLTLRR